ncbi:MAG: cydD [Nocardioidaceae bacterium]|nr:cydD [Nocardioidaceae bacterium]
MKPLDPRLVQRSRAVRRYLVLGVCLGLLTTVVIIAQAVLLSTAITRLFHGEAVTGLALAVAGCFLARAGLHWSHAVASSRAAVAVKADLRREIVADLLDPRRLGPAPRSSRVIALLGPGLDAFDGYVGRFLPQLILASLVPPIVVVAILVADPLSALVVAVTLPLSIIFMILIGLMTRDKVDQRWLVQQRLSSHFANVLDGLVVLKLFGRRQEVGIRDVGDRSRRETMRSLRLAFLSSLVMELIATLSVALVAVNVGLRVVSDNLDLRTALIVLLLAPEAYFPIRQLGAMFHDSAEGAEAVRDALDVLDHERHAGHLAPPALSTSDLDFADVIVEHPDRAIPSLSVQAAHIRPGEFVAITGQSGAGKSTLLDVILGFIAPTSGTVTIGGVDLADVDPERWREQIAWVPQVPGLIEGSVLDNVLLANSTATERDVSQALVDIGAADLYLQRWLSESAADVSAGERRRIALARAIVRIRTEGAHLLLLDEPTAGLDAARETRVLDVLRSLSVTVIVVAHRPETIAAADRVIRLDAPLLVTT